jgi:hypothetical protein
MADYTNQDAIPQGLIEQSRARPIDPGKLQLLGKQAAALYTGSGTSLNDAVLSVIGKEDLGPEHARRVCEFANQEAFQREWEKGGSVRNIEFSGGPADPAVVIRELNDGARPDAIRVSDYDESPAKLARADRRIEDEIFGKFAQHMTHHSEVPSGMGDLHRLKQTINGAQDHIHSKISSLGIMKEAMARELGDEVCKAVLSGDTLDKIASAWSHFCDKKDLFKEAMDVSISRMNERKVPGSKMEKRAGVEEFGKVPNPNHPLISKFIGFTKVAQQLRLLEYAVGVLKEQIPDVEDALAGKTKMANMSRSTRGMAIPMIMALNRMRGDRE